MKKILLTLILTIGIFTLAGCAPKTYDEINYNELNKLVENKEDFILFIGSTTCSACSSFKITVNKLVENTGVDIKYIDISKLTDDQNDYLLKHFPFNATPTTVFVTKGKEKNGDDRIVGNQKYSKVEAKLKEKGYIK